MNKTNGHMQYLKRLMWVTELFHVVYGDVVFLHAI